MSKKRSRQVAFSNEVTVVSVASYPVERRIQSEPKQQKLDHNHLDSTDTVNEDTISSNSSKSQHKPGSRLRDQLDSDSEPDDDYILYGKNKSDEQKEVNKERLETEGLDEEDMFAQEKGVLHFDGDIRVTPFNMDEEMEEGRFDSEGNYYTFRDEEVTDNWLTDIDWSNVDEQGEMLSQLESERQFFKRDAKVILSKEPLKDTSQTVKAVLSKSECISRIVCLLNPRETVAQALKRLKPNKQKGNRKEDISPSVDNNHKGQDNAFLELTELADLMCYHNEYDIYSNSLEKLQNNLTSYQIKNKFNSPDSNDICWEYKTEEREDSKLYGPFKSSQMLEWSTAGYFGEGVMVRRIDRRNGQFYNSKRVDFDIYT
ncbi:CD2 antigen cytoplasmic tail-binding protein 2 [Oopsacas minuta]|uniref:CD2 antigen cytoplasmic tail-binding protein 2 n=1 Tax=Oopsacas minuta TaxID=111878 RepID=A0AAV7KI11_9METZ|nr:CD2 antigen cytoplasmic tail-binding protein 2 [Oopsacas minuta]